MTRRQKQALRMATPRPSPEQRRANYERHLLAELAKIGWRIEPKGPYQLYLAKAG